MKERQKREGKRERERARERGRCFHTLQHWGRDVTSRRGDAVASQSKLQRESHGYGANKQREGRKQTENNKGMKMADRKGVYVCVCVCVCERGRNTSTEGVKSEA